MEEGIQTNDGAALIKRVEINFLKPRRIYYNICLQRTRVSLDFSRHLKSQSFYVQIDCLIERVSSLRLPSRRNYKPVGFKYVFYLSKYVFKSGQL